MACVCVFIFIYFRPSKLWMTLLVNDKYGWDKNVIFYMISNNEKLFLKWYLRLDEFAEWR